MPKFLTIDNAHLLRIQVSQTVRVLGLGRPGVALLQARVLRVELEVVVVDTRRGRVEVALDALQRVIDE